jgi:hypothetical protein
MNRTFHFSTLGTDIAFALIAAFMAMWPQILIYWLAKFLTLNSFVAQVIALLLAAGLLFVHYWTLRHHPSRFIPGMKQHGRQEMKILLQASLFALALFLTQIAARPLTNGLTFEHLFMIFSVLVLLFLGAFFSSKLEKDSQFQNSEVMDYITEVLSKNPRATQRVIEGYIRQQQIGGIIPRGIMVSLARMLIVQYFEQQNKYLHNTVVVLDSYHDPDNWKLLRVD